MYLYALHRSACFLCGVVLLLACSGRQPAAGRAMGILWDGSTEKGRAGIDGFAGTPKALPDVLLILLRSSTSSRKKSGKWIGEDTESTHVYL